MQAGWYNSAIYPDDETFKRLQILTDVGDKIKLYNKVWTSAKSQ